MSTFLSTQFDWDSAERSFSAEASMLTRGGRVPLFQRIYQDACDEGLELVSAKTGKIAKFVVEETKRDLEGDLQYWKLIPTADTKRTMPELSGVTIVIYND